MVFYRLLICSFLFLSSFLQLLTGLILRCLFAFFASLRCQSDQHSDPDDLPPLLQNLPSFFFSFSLVFF